MNIPPPPPPPLPPPPPPPTAAAPSAADVPSDFPDQVVEGCRKLELARGQEAELEALMVFSSSLLQQGDNNEANDEAAAAIEDDLPEALADVYTEIRSVYAQDGVTANNTEGAQKKKKVAFPPPGQFGKALETHLIASAIQGAAQQSADVYAARLTEGAALGGLISDKIRPVVTTSLSSSMTHPMLPVLDQRLQEIRTYHARHSSVGDAHAQRRVVADGFDLGARARQDWLRPLAADALFREPEVWGKYLDLERSEWLATMKNIVKVTDDQESGSAQRMDYIDFLQVLCQGLSSTVDTKAKMTQRKTYERFLIQLEDYLKDYLKRTVPLLDVQQHVIAPLLSPSTGTNDEGTDKKVNNEENAANEGIDLSGYNSLEALLSAVHTDTIKAELVRLGLKCGGTPLDRVKRLFLTKDKDPADWPAKIKAKGSAGSEAAKKPTSTSTTAAPAVTPGLPLATREAVVSALLDQVRPALEATLKRQERQQGQTLAEREKEIEEDLYGAEVVLPTKKKRKTSDDGEEEEEDSDDDDDGPIYNPKNVPLDWDGKPIPYWLFKLHGLQHYFTCEICSGESYRGRRNFELHFADQKHAAGMKSLGIPNTKHFHGITKIQDAQDLWESLQNKLKGDQFDTSKHEEYEDSKGNVVSRTAYEDLARQGLL